MYTSHRESFPEMNKAESGNVVVGKQDSAAGRLAEMGYVQELPRKLSMITILGLSFAIMAVPYGLSTTILVGLTDGGPVTVLWGWVFVSIVSLCIAGSLSEICSRFPTSGGPYFWAFSMSSPKYATIASWITGWLSLVGNWTVTLSINFGEASLILSAISLWNEDFVPEAWHTLLGFWAVTLICTLVNIFGNRWLNQLNTLCIYWTGASVIIILITLLSMAHDGRRSGAYVFSHYDATPSGWPSGWAWFVGLLQSAYVLTGYGMVAALCEEVQNPEREVPKAMVLSVAAAGVTGLLYLVPILFVLPDIRMLLDVATGQPIPLLFRTATGSSAGGFGLLFLILGIGFFGGVGALTAASRCTWSFARDGAIPGSFLWKKVNKRFEIPLNALLLSATVDALLALIYLGSTAAFNAFTGVATITLGASYAMPILISFLRSRGPVQGAPFALGALGWIINLITIVWIAFSIVLFCMPTAVPVDPSTMNYASVVFVGFASISALWYVVWGRKHYKGPPTARVITSSSTPDEGDSAEAEKLGMALPKN